MVYNSNFILLLMFAFPESNSFLGSHCNSLIFLLLSLWPLKCCGHFSCQSCWDSGISSLVSRALARIRDCLFVLILRCLAKIQLHSGPQLLEMINTPCMCMLSVSAGSQGVEGQPLWGEAAEGCPLPDPSSSSWFLRSPPPQAPR